MSAAGARRGSRVEGGGGEGHLGVVWGEVPRLAAQHEGQRPVDARRPPVPREGLRPRIRPVSSVPPPRQTAVTARDARALLQGRGGEEAKEADPAVEEEGDVDRGKAGLDEVLLGPKVRHRAVLRRNRNERLPGFEKYWKGMLTLSGGNVG